MSENEFDDLKQLAADGGADAVFERLIALLQEQKQPHRLFDARMLRRKHALGLSLARPTSFDDVPEEHRAEVEGEYIAAAREAGELFLADGDIPSAWMYLQVIREPGRVAAAIEALPLDGEFDEKLEQIMQIALFERVHPVKGIRMMLRSHGICSTITALDQAMGQLTAAQRQECAGVLVRQLYEDLTANVGRQVRDRMPDERPASSLRELIADRDWLFEGGNYHIDVSHLSSVVRFARTIEPPAEELDLAIQLCEYGCRLAPQLQYPGEPPFDEFYPAHRHFFRIVLDDEAESSLDYFRRRLADEPDERDQPLLAYVLVDLLMRSGRLDEAVDVAAKHLTNLGPDARFSFAALCAEAGRFDRLAEVARQQGDLVGYAAALVGRPQGSDGPGASSPT